MGRISRFHVMTPFRVPSCSYWQTLYSTIVTAAIELQKLKHNVHIDPALFCPH